MALTLGFIVNALGGELSGSDAQPIHRLAPLHSAGPDAISFISHERFRTQLQACKAGAVILSPAMRHAIPAGVAWLS